MIELTDAEEPMIDEEIWREAPGHDGRYEVSSLGRIRSWIKMGPAGSGRLSEPRLLKPGITRGNYLIAQLRTGGKNHAVRLNRLVLFAFEGAPPREDMQACHSNGNRQDNRLSNLYWGTSEENYADRSRHAQERRERDAGQQVEE